MKTIWTIGILTIALAVQVCAQTESDLVIELDSLEHKLMWTEQRIAEEQLAQLRTGDSDSLAFYRSLQIQLLDHSFPEAQHNSIESFTESTDQRRFELLETLSLLTKIDLGPTIRPVFDSLQIVFSDYYATGERMLQDSLANVVNTGGRRSDREAAWRMLTAAPENDGSTMARLFRLRNRAAGKLGYRNYFSVISRLIVPEGADYGRRLDEVDSLTQRPYRRLIDDLSAAYQPSTLEIWDVKSSFNNTVMEADRFFPPEIQMDLVKSCFSDLGFELDNLPIYFHQDSLFLIPGRFKPIAVNVPDDIRVVGKPAKGLRSLTSLMRAVGIAVFYSRVKEDSPTLSRMIDPAWLDAMGDLFEQLCYSGEWLSRYGNLPADLIRRLGQTRRAFQLIDARHDLVMARFEWDAYNGQMPDLNDRYWELFSNILRLPKHDDLSPWASTPILINEPLYYYRRLMGRAAALQTFAYLEEAYPSLFSGQVGAFLIHNYFRFGNRYKWGDLVERATGEPLSVTSLATP